MYTFTLQSLKLVMNKEHVFWNSGQYGILPRLGPIILYTVHDLFGWNSTV